MKSFLLSPQTFQDIYEIWEFIAQDNLGAADRVRDKIFEAFENRLRCPGWGTFARTSPKSRFGLACLLVPHHLQTGFTTPRNCSCAAADAVRLNARIVDSATAGS